MAIVYISGIHPSKYRSRFPASAFLLDVPSSRSLMAVHRPLAKGESSQAYRLDGCALGVGCRPSPWGSLELRALYCQSVNTCAGTAVSAVSGAPILPRRSQIPPTNSSRDSRTGHTVGDKSGKVVSHWSVVCRIWQFDRYAGAVDLLHSKLGLPQAWLFDGQNDRV